MHFFLAELSSALATEIKDAANDTAYIMYEASALRPDEVIHQT